MTNYKLSLDTFQALEINMLSLRLMLVVVCLSLVISTQARRKLKRDNEESLKTIEDQYEDLDEVD